MQLNLVGDGWNDLPQQAKLGNPMGNYDSASTRMLASDKAQAKIVRRLENVPHDFNVYLLQGAKQMTGTYHKNMMKSLYPQMGITPQQAPIIDNKINMFITSWQQEPPTAWMIVHRFAHANTQMATEVSNALTQFGKQMTRIQSDYGLVSGFGTMKSAMTNQLGAGDEPSHEVITQHIMTGKVTFNPARKMWANNQRDQLTLEQLSTHLNQLIANFMRQATNSVYIVF